MEKIQVTRDEVRSMFNEMDLGSIITSKTIPNINQTTVTWLLKDLNQSNYVERISRGHYKLLKKIPLKNKKRRNSTRTVDYRKKDVSMIPTILKYNKNGLVIGEIKRIYNNLTPVDKQVTTTYLYKLFGFAQREGIIVKNGNDEKFRRSKIGKPPSKYALVDSTLSDECWKNVVRKYRRSTYGDNEIRKYKRKIKSKTIREKFACCESIVDHFGENRDNPNKLYAEGFFLQKVQERLKDDLLKCFVVTGPDYFHHMDSLFTTVANKVLVCEIAPDVFDVIYNKSQICPYFINKKVSVLKCDVNDLAPVNCRYTDIDLMCTLKTNYQIISEQLRRQDANCNKHEEKYFTFTCTRRNQKDFSITVKYLQKLLKQYLGANLSTLSTGHEVRDKQKGLRSCKQHYSYFSNYGRILKFYLFTYQDKTPMMNALIVYK